MRKVTKGLLAASFAALVMNACQDSVSIVQPAPPPPPPPPPSVDATVTIQGLRSIPANQPVNPTNVFGDINVVLNIEEGDNTVTQVDLLFDGAPIGCAAISTSTAPGDGVALSSAAAADVVECFWNTDGVAGECIGEQLDPAFGNGTFQLGARITLDDGTTREANNVQTVTMTNSDFIMLEAALDGAPVIGTNGRAYVGGPNDAVNVEACPVSYNDITVGELGIGGYSTLQSANGGQDADLGSGPGNVHQDDTSPFIFNLDPTANGGGGVLGEIGGVEDDPTGAGHNFGDDGVMGCNGATQLCIGPVFADDGLNVTSNFAYGSIIGVYADFVGPAIAAGATIEIDAMAVMTGEHYSSGDYGLSANVTDEGVGLLAGGQTVFNTNDCDGGAATCGSGTNAVVVADATGIDELTEDDELDDGDTNGFDTYEVEVASVADDLGNASSAAQLANITTNPEGPFGVDMTEPDITNDLPATASTDDPWFVLNDITTEFDAADPDLASGDVGSGVDVTGCNPCTAIDADDGNGPYTVNGIGATTFEVDLTGMVDGEVNLVVDVPDYAVLNPNVATHTYYFIYDTTAPDIKPFTDFESDATLSGSAATFTLAGQVVDGDGVPNSGPGSTISAFSVGIYTDAGATCAAADITALTEGTGAGEVDNQLRSVGDTDGGELDFTMNTTEDWNFDSTFLVQNPGAGLVSYCMITTATDSTMDNDGVANSNTGMAYNRFTINWQ